VYDEYFYCHFVLFYHSTISLIAISYDFNYRRVHYHPIIIATVMKVPPVRSQIESKSIFAITSAILAKNESSWDIIESFTILNLLLSLH